MEIQSISNPGGLARSPGTASATDIKQHAAAEVVKPAAAAVPTSSVDAVQAASATPKPEEVKESVKKINTAIQSISRDLEFSVDEDTKMNVVKVVDIKTKDVIRQFPSEEVLAIAKALDKLQGLLLKEKA
ncbi:MAG: flagellar protein FlaG [Sulfuricellaceae bacterium]